MVGVSSAAGVDGAAIDAARLAGLPIGGKVGGDSNCHFNVGAVETNLIGGEAVDFPELHRDEVGKIPADVSAFAVGLDDFANGAIDQIDVEGPLENPGPFEGLALSPVFHGGFTTSRRGVRGPKVWLTGGGFGIAARLVSGFRRPSSGYCILYSSTA